MVFNDMFRAYSGLQCNIGGWNLQIMSKLKMLIKII